MTERGRLSAVARNICAIRIDYFFNADKSAPWLM